MSNFTLKQDGYTGYTTIPNCFIEQFMPYAAGEFVKIYIFLLKCISENQSELSISRIADAFNNTEKDVVRALKYWQRKGLLKLTFDEDEALTSLCVVSLSDNAVNGVPMNVTDAPVPGQPGINQKRGKDRPKEAEPVPVKETESKENAMAAVPPKKEYTKSELAEFSEKDELAQLFYIVQKYLGRTLTGQDTGTILYLYDTLGFSAELIEYLIEYCVSKGHRSIRYIEKTGIAWAEEGIMNVRAAKLMAGIYSDDCYKVLEAFGINNRRPTKGETDHVSRWTLSYGFDISIIVDACRRTMDKLHQPNFEYTDAILKNWKSHGVVNRDDIRKLDEVFEEASAKKEKPSGVKVSGSRAAVTGRFNSFAQRNYDYSSLEQQLFNRK